MKKLLDLLKKPKAKIVAAAGGGCAVVAAVVVAVLLSRQESYRTVAVAETNGITLVVNETSAGENAYVGMHLYSGDDVTVQNSADLTLLLDMDKYVYAEEHTHFWLETAGSSDKGRTVIHLAEGSELNRLKNQLKEGESYQVDTPNSTMAVRGTVFRVTVYYDENGMAYTLIEVLDGAVQVDLKTVEGSITACLRPSMQVRPRWYAAIRILPSLLWVRTVPSNRRLITRLYRRERQRRWWRL